MFNDNDFNERKNSKPVRDSSGRFVKGHKPLTRPKYKLMKEHPKLLCINCYMQCNCPEYFPHYVCAYRREFQKIETRRMDKVVDSLQAIFYKTHDDYCIACEEEIFGVKSPAKASRLIMKAVRQGLLLIELYMQIDIIKKECLI